jgi:two-component SAPR family response regulator
MLSTREGKMASSEETKKSSFPGLRVMVAEDDWLLALNIQALLDELGCAVIGPAANVNDAQRLAEENSFDIALLDVRFQYNDTSNLIAQILKKKRVPFAYVTGYSESDLRQWKMPKAFILQKPVTASNLAATITVLSK